MIDSDRNGSPRAWQGLEALEPRCLLSGNGVIGVTQGLPDLQVTIAPSFKTPANTLSGVGKVINLPIQITNLDETNDAGQTVAVPAGETATIVVVAHPENALDDSQDIQVGTLIEVPVGGMKVGAKQNLTVPVTLTDDVGDVQGGANENWQLVVTLDSTDTVAELGEDPSGNPVQTNNIASTVPFPVVMGRPDLTISISDKGLPNTATSATGTIYKVPVRITNNGTVAIPKGATTTVGVTLASLLDPTSTSTLDPVPTVDIGGLAPGHSVNTVVTFDLTNKVNDDKDNNGVDQQTITFTVDPDDSIKELHEDNNTATSKTITVTDGAPVLEINPAANNQLPTKPILSGTDKPIQVNVKLTNVGNVTWNADLFTAYKVTLVAIPFGVPPAEAVIVDDDPTDEIDLVAPNLAPNKSFNYSMDRLLPINMPTGEYQLYIRTRFTDLEGREATVFSLASLKPINVTDGFINLVPTIDPSSVLPKVTTSGNGSTYKMVVDIKNLGNLPTPTDASIGAKLDLVLDDQPDDPGPAVAESDDTPITIGVIAPGKTERVTVSYFIENGVGLSSQIPDVYEQEVTLVDTDNIKELITGDNSAFSKTERVIMGDPDLTLALPAKLKLPASVLDGTGQSINLPLVIRNSGNLPIPDSTTTTIEVSAIDADGNPTLVATLDNIDISKLKAGGTQNVTVPVTLPNTLLTGDYTFSAVIDPDNSVEELNDANNTTPATASVHVTQGLVDFAATIDAPALEGANVNAGDGSIITLPLVIQNLGNLATAKGQLIDIRVFALDGDGTSTDVTTIVGVKIGGLKPGGQLKTNITFALPITLLSGNYQLGAEVDAGHVVLEPGDTDLNSTPLNGANNTALGPNVNVTQTGPDLTIAFDPSLDLPASVVSGDGTLITLPLTITNDGDLAVAKGVKITVLIQTHNQADGDGATNDVDLLEIDNVNVGGLAPGTSESITATVTLPAGIGPGEFVIVATVDSKNQLPQLDDVTKIATTDPAGVTPSVIL